MKAARRIAAVASLVLVTFALAGCASEAPASVPTTHSNAPSPSATASEPALIVPSSRIPATCDGLVPPSSSALLTDDAKSEIETYSGDDFQTASMRQSGALACHWLNPGTDGSGPLGSIDLSVAVVDQTTYDTLGSRYMDQGATDSGFAGDQSALSCFDETCRSNMRVGDYWTQLNIYSKNDVDRVDFVKTQLASIAEILRAGGPTKPSYRAAAGSLDLGTSCDVFDGDDTFEIPFGLSGEDSYRASDGPTPPNYAAVRDTNLACSWEYGGGDSAAIAVFILPGGAWAWPPVPEVGGYLDQPEYFNTVSVTGADSGYQGCLDGTCVANLLVKGSWVRIVSRGDDASAFVRSLNAAVPALIALDARN